MGQISEKVEKVEQLRKGKKKLGLKKVLKGYNYWKNLNTFTKLKNIDNHF